MRRITFLGTQLPRQCGIATYTGDLTDAISAIDSTLEISALAMASQPGDHYPRRVVGVIAEDQYSHYAPAARAINALGDGVLSVQHEYGIYGGGAGEYLIALLREVNVPVVTTLHTVLEVPTREQKAVFDAVLDLSTRVVVMSQRAVTLLERGHGFPRSRIDVIPHGIPKIDAEVGFGLRARRNISSPMILTFGLLSPDKGIEYVIRAMPMILAQYPEATYYVVGATHPTVRAQVGEKHRMSLEQLASDLGVESQVHFVNRFVTSHELVEYLAAMDIYVTPYLNPQQITSGTLAYAMGSGKALISTPYLYAQEMLDDGRGLLVPFRDAEAIANGVNALQSDPTAGREMGRRSADFAQAMLWSEVGRDYLEAFQRAVADSAAIRKASSRPYSLPVTIPDVNLSHLRRMSDDTGLLQHATYSTPCRAEGYCVDDNARALRLTVMLQHFEGRTAELSALQSSYLAFVYHAFNPDEGRFRNFMDYRRNWLETEGSEDSHGRSVWALGGVIRYGQDAGQIALAQQLFAAAIPALLDATSPRTWAYGLLGAEDALVGFPGVGEYADLRKILAYRLWRSFELFQAENWPWFEATLSYANARIPQALLAGARALDDGDMAQAALDSLGWLMGVQTGPEGVFAPIGSDAPSSAAERFLWDQQPVEAAGAVSACLAAGRHTNDYRWEREAARAFRWFSGANMRGESLIDLRTGACLDGIHEDRLNQNQGAESTISYLTALVEMGESVARPRGFVGRSQVSV